MLRRRNNPGKGAGWRGELAVIDCVARAGLPEKVTLSKDLKGVKK